MADKPIIFSAPMVGALLDGRKSMTRRVLKPQPESPRVAGACLMGDQWVFTGRDGSPLGPIYMPYAPGDRLWVKEAFVSGFDVDDNGRAVGERKVWYRATDSGLSWYDPDSESTLDNPPWRSPRFMPRWASRLTLTVTDVRMQRVQDISDDDARAEGVQQVGEIWIGGNGYAHSPQDAFMVLWREIHGPGAWDANPWVAALTFTVRQGNIDA